MIFRQLFNPADSAMTYLIGGATSGEAFVIGRHNDPTLAGDRVADGDVLRFGDESIAVIETPGHTPGCVTYYWRDRIFCGDVLELGGCGQAVDETDAGQMYYSVRKRIYSLPGETLIFPGHDYAGRTVSTVAEERQRNVTFTGLSRDRFIEHMAHLEKRPVPNPDTDSSDQSPVI